MKRLARIAAIALVVTGVLTGLFGGAQTTSAANGMEQWTGGYSDGCFYYWDGYAYTMGACPRSDGGFDFTVASYGVWAYSFSAGWTTDGGTWLFYQGQYYIQSPYYGYVGGGDSNLTSVTTVQIGAPTWEGLTGNVLVDQIMADSNNRMIDTILQPTCIEVVGNTCYY